jgi:hypothetical protein
LRLGGYFERIGCCGAGAGLVAGLVAEAGNATGADLFFSMSVVTFELRPDDTLR